MFFRFVRTSVVLAPLVLVMGATPSSPETNELNKLQFRILELTNQARAEAGCEPLRGSDLLDRIALRHSRDMAENDFLGHSDARGRDHITRARSAGFPTRYVGENVAAGNASPLRTFKQWMNSPPHRKNILDCSFTELGVGYAYEPNSEWKHYWTQMFGDKQSGEQNQQSGEQNQRPGQQEQQAPQDQQPGEQDSGPIEQDSGPAEYAEQRQEFEQQRDEHANQRGEFEQQRGEYAEQAMPEN